MNSYDGYTLISTDGSKLVKTVGAAAIVASRVHNKLVYLFGKSSRITIGAGYDKSVSRRNAF